MHSRELRPFGISVHLVEPGPFNTAIISTNTLTAKLTSSWNRLSEEKRQEYGKDLFQIL